MSKKLISIYKEYHPSEVDSQEASKIAIQEKLLRRQSLTVTLVASISEEDLGKQEALKIITIAPPMLEWDMTSPSISGHHKMSLKDGSILLDEPLEAPEAAPPPFSILLLLFIAKAEFDEAIASVAIFL